MKNMWRMKKVAMMTKIWESNLKPARKRRRSCTDPIKYLVQKSAKESELKKEELELKRQELELKAEQTSCFQTIFKV